LLSDQYRRWVSTVHKVDRVQHAFEDVAHDKNGRVANFVEGVGQCRFGAGGWKTKRRLEGRVKAVAARFIGYFSPVRELRVEGPN